MFLKGLIQKYSIRKILVCYMLIFTLIPSVMLYTFFYTYSIKVITEKYLDSYLNSVYTQCENNINSLIYSINMMILNITYYQELYDVIFDNSLNYDKKQALFSKNIEYLISDNAIINGVEIITNNGFRYSYYEKEIKQTNLTKEYLSALPPNKLLFSDQYTSDTNGNYYLIAGKRFYNVYNLYDAGVIVVYINEGYIQRLYQDSNFENSTFLLTMDDLIISHTDKSQIGIRTMLLKNKFINRTIIKNDLGTYLLSSAKINNNSLASDLSIISIVSYQDMYMLAKNLNTYTTILLAACILISLIIAFFLPKNLLKAIISLKNRMDNFALDTIPEQNTIHNEIVALESGFNSLTAQISELIRKNDEEKESKRVSELRALQAQINPHFVYNALDAICWLAKIEKQTKIEKMAFSLASFFRLGLQKGESMITVENEIAHVKSYLEVEQFRFPELFEVQFDIEESILKFNMIKIVLQPLVENSVLHAFEDIDYKGLIVIRGRLCQNSDICFEIEDNGIGMDSNPLEFPAKSKETYGGYGIYNVQQRLTMKYGKDYGLIIRSSPGNGTKVSFKIKC